MTSRSRSAARDGRWVGVVGGCAIAACFHAARSDPAVDSFTRTHHRRRVASSAGTQGRSSDPRARPPSKASCTSAGASPPSPWRCASSTHTTGGRGRPSPSPPSPARSVGARTRSPTHLTSPPPLPTKTNPDAIHRLGDAHGPRPPPPPAPPGRHSRLRRRLRGGAALAAPRRGARGGGGLLRRVHPGGLFALPRGKEGEGKGPCGGERNGKCKARSNPSSRDTLHSISRSRDRA